MKSDSKSHNMKGKKRQFDMSTDDRKEDQMDLFAKLNMNSSSDEEADADTTDSDESVYSGLEDEPDTSDEESAQDEADCTDENSSDDEESEGDDDQDDDDDSASSETESKQIPPTDVKKKVSRNTVNTAGRESSKPSSKTKTSKSPSDVKQHKSDVDSTSKQSSVTSTAVPSKLDSTRPSEGGSTVQPKGGSTSTSSQGDSTVPDEYEFDSSDEEDLRNTVGNIPMEWYREYEHIGYNLLGKKIIKPKTGDELDNFLNKMDNPDYWRTIVDKSTGQNVVISEKDAEFIKRLRRGKYVDSSYDPYKPWIDFFTYETMQHPVTNRPADKRSFIPSNWERLKVGRMVHAIKMGWMKPKTEKKKDDDDDVPNYYSLWEADNQSDLTRRLRGHIPAPKLSLPGHEESYNPPPEYLPTEEEELAWKDQDPEDRRTNFLPKSYSSLRQVAAYPRFINERFERCLDLYLCPRQRKLRMNVDPEDLLPKLPKPKDLQPFPITQALMYKGHTDLVRCISVDPTGQWLVSGCDDQTIKFWEVLTGRCMRTLNVGGVVKGMCWNPNTSLCLVAAIVEENVVIVNPQLGDKLVLSNTDTLIEGWAGEGDTEQTGQGEWHAYSEPEYSQGFRLRISHSKTLGQATWHARGDYLAVVLQGTESKSVLIHQISRRRSQNPFRKAKGLVQCVLFHPTRPFFFVATQRYVRVYNLLKQELTKKLMTNVKWVSSMAVHPGGDNLIIGSYDCRLSWFDLDLSTKPYQTLRHHKRAIRQVCYHKKYPLFASASDDGSVIVCHGRVYNDLLQNPLIVPVKVLRGHDVKNKLGVLDCVFHPTQPWIFSSGGDNTIRLFS